MKRSHLIFVIVIVFVLIVCFLWWFFFSQPSESVKEVQQDNPKPISKAQETQQPQQSVAPKQKVQKSKKEMAREGLSLLNHQPIEFYGKAVDQNGEPIVDAEVIGHVQINDGYRTTSENHQTTTDGQGFFAFHGFSGRDLGVAIHKGGYEQAPNSGGFFFSLMFREKVHKPDPNNPVVFKMWKLAGAEPMMQSEGARIGVPCDGTPVLFDLHTGKKVISGGDLRITFVRTPLHIDRSKPFDWNANLEIINGGGGLAECNDVFPYVAPESGYQALVQIDMPITFTNWVSSYRKKYYIKLRDGKSYGLLKLQITANYEPPPTGFTFESRVNPSGSRNLEWDPLQQVSPDRIVQVGLEKAIEEAKREGKKQHEEAEANRRAMEEMDRKERERAGGS